MSPTSPTVVRPRRDADLDACIALIEATHKLDGYPIYLPTDLRGFLVSPDALAVWVAERGGEIVGHAALYRRSLPALMALASQALRQPEERMGVVARLFVGPSARRSGTGRALLDVARREAVAQGLWPILDVGAALHAAIRLYEDCGWTRLGAVTVQLDDGSLLDEFVYVAPAGPESGSDGPHPKF